MKTRSLALIATLGLISAAALSQASITVATFADPSNNASLPLFTLTSTSIAGSWTGLGLNLRVADDAAGSTYTTYNDVKMRVSGSGAGGVVTRSGSAMADGSAVFYTAGNANLLTISWASGTVVEPFLSGASYINSNNVNFAGTAVAGLPALTQQQFAFSFANPSNNGNANTYTASMTSSASPVPEPVSLTAILGLGLAAAARRRKA